MSKNRFSPPLSALRFVAIIGVVSVATSTIASEIIAPGHMTPGLWEFKSKMVLPNMSPEVQERINAQTAAPMQRCIKPEDTDISKIQSGMGRGARAQQCEKPVMTREGNAIKWTTKCPNGESVATLTPMGKDQFTMNVINTSERGTMTVDITGKKVSDTCPAPKQ
jgi:Protein of unknown function (DUF3617)